MKKAKKNKNSGEQKPKKSNLSLLRFFRNVSWIILWLTGIAMVIFFERSFRIFRQSKVEDLQIFYREWNTRILSLWILWLIVCLILTIVILIKEFKRKREWKNSPTIENTKRDKKSNKNKKIENQNRTNDLSELEDEENFIE